MTVSPIPRSCFKEGKGEGGRWIGFLPQITEIVKKESLVITFPLEYCGEQKSYTIVISQIFPGCCS